MSLGVIASRPVLVNWDTAGDIERASKGRSPAHPERLFDAWDSLVEWTASAEPDGKRLSPERLQNPVPAPRQVFGTGANYLDHVEEAAKAHGHVGDAKALLPKDPMIFTRFRTSLSGPCTPSRCPAEMSTGRSNS